MKTFTASLLFAAANAEGIFPEYLNPGAVRASRVCIDNADSLPLDFWLNNLVTGQVSLNYNIDKL